MAYYEEIVKFDGEISSVFSVISQSWGFKRTLFEDFKENRADYNCSFIYPLNRVNLTYRAKIQINLMSCEKNNTIVHFVVEACEGKQNITADSFLVEEIVKNISKKFKVVSRDQISLKDFKAKNEKRQKVNSIMGGVACVLLLVAIVAVGSLIFKGCSELFGDSNSDVCGICGGTGVFQGKRCWCIGR